MLINDLFLLCSRFKCFHGIPVSLNCLHNCWLYKQFAGRFIYSTASPTSCRCPRLDSFGFKNNICTVKYRFLFLQWCWMAVLTTKPFSYQSKLNCMWQQWKRLSRIPKLVCVIRWKQEKHSSNNKDLTTTVPSVSLVHWLEHRTVVGVLWGRKVITDWTRRCAQWGVTAWWLGTLLFLLQCQKKIAIGQH